MHNVENPTIQHPASGDQKPNTSILLALAVALIMHALVLLVPLSSEIQESGPSATLIEIQLTAFAPPEQLEEIVEAEPIPEPVPEPPPAPEPTEEPVPVPLLSANHAPCPLSIPAWHEGSCVLYLLQLNNVPAGRLHRE